MYTDEETRGVPIKTFIISLILIIVFILLLMWLLPIPKISGSNDSNNNNNNNNNNNQGNVVREFPNIDGLLNRIFIDNVDSMKNAAISYFTTDKLPGKVGDSVTLTLQEMLDKHLLLPFTDKEGKSCDTSKSYVSLTKLNDSYELKVNLKCGEEEAYILVPMGCYSYCTSAICQNKEQTTKYVQVSTDKTKTIVDNKGDEVIVKTSPRCELYVSTGTLGDNSWYISDAVVKFKSKYATTSGAKITSYGLSTQASALYNNQDSYTVNNDGTTTVYGYVKDSNGYTSTCSITVKKDTVKPSCELSVLSGTKASNGVYVSDITVGFSSRIDEISGISNYGLGNTSTVLYNKLSKYNITTNGTHKIYGYVMDKAGHTAVCDLTVKRDKPSTPVVSNPSCTLKVTSGTVGTNGWYKSNVVIGFATKTSTNNATITSFGLGTSENYNGSDTYTVNNDGTTTVYGYVKDSNGYTSTCSITVKKDDTKPNCQLSVLSGVVNEQGIYVSDASVGLTTKTDATSGLANYGMSNYTKAVYNKIVRFKVLSNGTHKIYGYVIDKAGNTAMCDITLKRETPTPVVSNPSCSLEVTNGTVGTNGWYKSNVVIGFATKTSTNNATITSFGLGTSENYNGSDTYTVNNDGTTTVYGYVKDSNGYTSTCSITVKKDDTKPNCALKVTSGTEKDGYYTSNVTVSLTSKTDAASGVANYGIGTSKVYNKNTTYTVSTKGTTTVYGYVQDTAGNENVCSINVQIKDSVKTEYEYVKSIEAQYSDWSSWTTSTYNPSNPPKFGSYALIEMVDLGKTQEVDHYNESTGKAFYQNKPVKVGTTTEKYCSGYDYYREKTTSTTIAVKSGSSWNSIGMVTTSSAPTDTASVKYEFVGFDWKCTGCERTPRYIWNKYNRTTYEVKSAENMVTKSGVKAVCNGYETKTVEVFDTVKVFVDYEIVKTPVYKDVYKYKKRTRTLVKNAYIDYVWSYYNDKTLLDKDYKYTGKTRTA